MSNKIIEKLKDDAKYYGDFGKKFLSASDVSTLLYSPENFKQEKKSPEILMGRYFHQIILEPNKPVTIPIIESSTRTTKKFKDFIHDNELDMYDVMLEKERDLILKCRDKLMSVMFFSELIHDQNNQYEVPAVMELHGNTWKSKCDILHQNYVIDLKTTGNGKNFRSSSRAFCYNAQAYVYQLQYQRPMVFIVIDKNTMMTYFCPCSQEFIEYGEQNVLRATEIYNKYYGENKTEDISQHYQEILL